METRSKSKFYETTWFMWLTLIFFAPVGIFLMWKYNRFGKGAKVALSLIFGVFFLMAVIGGSTGNSTDTSTTSSNSQASKTTSEDQKKKDADSKVKKEADAKAKAEQKAKDEADAKSKADADAKAKQEAEAKQWSDFVAKNTKQLSAGEFTIGTHLDSGVYDVTFNGSGNFNIYSNDGTLLTNEIGNSELGISKYRAIMTDGGKIKISGMSANFKPIQRSLLSYSNATLYAGYWIVGKDVTKGRYKAVAPNGSGNFIIYDKDSMPKVNEILGGDGGVKEVTIDLNDGDIITISSLNQVNLSPEK